jgi:hypothetical protein
MPGRSLPALFLSAGFPFLRCALGLVSPDTAVPACLMACLPVGGGPGVGRSGSCTQGFLCAPCGLGVSPCPLPCMFPLSSCALYSGVSSCPLRTWGFSVSPSVYVSACVGISAPRFLLSHCGWWSVWLYLFLCPFCLVVWCGSVRASGSVWPSSRLLVCLLRP